jgi:hypothetical protein
MMLAVALVAPSVVDTWNVPVEAPTGIEMDAGTVAAPVLSEDRVTVVATGAAADRVTVPVEAVPPRTLVGLRVTVETLGTAAMVSVAVGAPPLSDAPIVDVPLVRVCVVVMLKVPVVAPAATVTDAGTVARAVLLELSATT